MHRRLSPSVAAAAIAIFTVLAACSSSPRVAKTFEDHEYANASFSNFLVIGVAGDYDARAQFERTVSSRIRNEGASASAYYSIVEGNEPLNRDAVLDVIRNHGFDAVVVTRVVSQKTDVSVTGGTANTKVSTIGGGPVNFFRYDYDELNEPDTINVSTRVVLGTELFSAKDEKMIWAIETTNPGANQVGQLIEDTADTIIQRLTRDRLISQ